MQRVGSDSLLSDEAAKLTEIRKRKDLEQEQGEAAKKAKNLQNEYASCSVFNSVERHRIYLAFQKIIADGWENVTDHSIQLKKELLRVGEVYHPPLRQARSPGFLLQLFLEEVSPVLANDSTQNIPTSTGKVNRMKQPFSSLEMVHFMLVLVEVIAYGPRNLKEFVRAGSLPGGLSPNRFETIRKHLKVDVVKMVPLWYSCWKRWVKVPGAMTLDESIWPWLSSSPAVIHVERKPNADGIRVQNLCFRFTKSLKPVSIRFVPEVPRPAATATLALEWARVIAASFTASSFTGDSWYGSWNWAMANGSSYFTLALPAGQAAELMEVFAYELRMGQYRIFRKGSLLLVVFADAKLVKTITSCYDVASTAAPLPSPAAPSLHALMDMKPRLSMDSVSKLQSLDLAELKVLAGALGEAVSMHIFCHCFVSAY
jgi:hypothetical protein